MAKNPQELTERLYNSLPKIYRYLDREHGNQLQRFLQIVSEGGFFPSYQKTKDILDLFDIDTAPVERLPDLASALGFQFPYELDEQTQRTYIKNAVLSYKSKGTEDTLLFMIRELTRFPVSLGLDKKNKVINVYLEVDEFRQDHEKVVDKVEFIVRDYAPPVKEINIINSYIWNETWEKVLETNELLTILKTLNDETFDRNKITLQENYGIITMNPIDEIVELVEILDEHTDIYNFEDSETLDMIVAELMNVNKLTLNDSHKKYTYLNRSRGLRTRGYSEPYATSKAKVEYFETITMV